MVATAIPPMTRATPASWSIEGTSCSRMPARMTVAIGWASRMIETSAAGSLGSEIEMIR
jgi:hypothetical protein